MEVKLVIVHSLSFKRLYIYIYDLDDRWSTKGVDLRLLIKVQENMFFVCMNYEVLVHLFGVVWNNARFKEDRMCMYLFY